MVRVVLFFLSLMTLRIVAAPLDELETIMRDKPQVQEKVYVHTDNSTYFVGDTLWYKAYVSRADNLKPTNYSKLLYVELLTPDGYLVERQRVVINQTGQATGQFVLVDSLYSGFYEVRAYTRWQLNFNVTEKDYTRDDALKFYGKDNARDFFRNWEGLYSRVIPVYQKPREKGDYVERYMAHRPKTRVLKDKEFLTMSFYPEGGQLIEGVSCNLAFELMDNHGERFDLEGTLSDGSKIKTQRLGMGQVTITPTAAPLKATFAWKGKDYTFTLPKAQQQGVALKYDAEKKTVTVSAKGIKPAAYAVLCRGQLQCFERMTTQTVDLSAKELATGVNEIIIYDDNAQPLASRLFFVNNHDFGKMIDIQLTSKGSEIARNTTIEPYAPIDIEVRGVNDTALAEGRVGISLAIRDAQTDERGYDNGNIMTDMLLSSELRGFIAYPAYYFESDDAQHKSDLDLLMKVQGWRRYKRVEKLRYLPERMPTFEGCVYTVPEEAGIMEYDDLDGVGKPVMNMADVMRRDMGIDDFDTDISTSTTTLEDSESEDASKNTSAEEVIEWADNDDTRLGSGRLRKSVLVEAEINKNGEMAGAITRTDRNGHFRINLPPFAGWAYMFVKAYTRGDSIKKNMQSGEVDSHFMDERAFPDFFVKQDRFFPIYSQPYSWYQTNSPQLTFVDEEDENIPETSRLAGDHQLQTVIVKARRRGRRAIDMSKPAIVMDAYDLYNELSDRGLMYGVCDFRAFPLKAATYLFGNMGRRNQFKIRALLNGTSFYRNYVPSATEYDKPRSQADVFKNLRLERMMYVKAYTDYELRTDSGDVVNSNVADVTLDFVTIDNDGRRPTYRDRRYVIDGIAQPEEFYSPNYAEAVPEKPTDYRRTLYWNPNVKLDAEGRFTTTIYNNCRETRVTVSAAGLDDKGQMYYK